LCDFSFIFFPAFDIVANIKEIKKIFHSSEKIDLNITKQERNNINPGMDSKKSNQSFRQKILYSMNCAKGFANKKIYSLNK
jgi:hypothetical protein